MLLDDKKKKKFYRPKQRKSLPTQTPSNVTQQPAETQPTVTPGNDVRPQPFTFFNQQQPAQQQPIIAQEAAPPTNQQNSLPPTGMQSLVTQGYDPTMLMQSIVNSPTLARIKENDEKIARLKETPVQDKDGFWWSFAKAGLSGLAQAFNPANPIRNDGDFYNRLGYAAGSAVGGGVNRKWNEVQNIQNEISRAYQENEILTERAKQEFDMQQKATQFGFNVNKEQNDRAEFDRRQQLNEDKFIQNKKDSFFRRYRAFNPLLASESQIRELKEFGETPESVGKYDFTNPKEKTVNGVSYLYNPLTQSYEESGLPNDPSKAIYEYEVEDSVTGVKHKFAVSAENAARFRTSIENARMMVKAANERQQKQQEFQRSQLEIRQDFEREERVWRAKQDEIKFARDEESKAKARQEAEESRKRILKLQHELEYSGFSSTPEN